MSRNLLSSISSRRRYSAARAGSPATVQVEGWSDRASQITLGAAFSAIDRLRAGPSSATLGLPNVTFSYYVDITQEDTETVNGVYADVAVFSRLLDDADAPVARQDIVNALHTTQRDPTADEIVVLRRRADNAITHLVNAELIRSIMVWYSYKGWVWNDRQMTDEDWIKRGKQPQPEPPIGLIRISAPEAFVVVVGSPEVLDEQD